VRLLACWVEEGSVIAHSYELSKKDLIRRLLRSFLDNS